MSSPPHFEVSQVSIAVMDDNPEAAEPYLSLEDTDEKHLYTINVNSDHDPHLNVDKELYNNTESTFKTMESDRYNSMEIDPYNNMDNSPVIDKQPEASKVAIPDIKTEDVKKTKKEIKREKCMSCCKSFMAFLFSTVGLTCVMVGYTVFGGFIFMKLEAPYEQQLKSNVMHSRKWHADMLWKLNDQYNVFYPQNWTYMAEQLLKNYTREVYSATKHQGWDGKDELSDLQWTFAGSLLYSITVITTIGYGHIAPKTDWGRIVTILYAIIGIPITLLTIANLGNFMATAFRFLYKHVCCGICCCSCCRNKPREGVVKSAAVKYKDPKNGDAGASHALTEETELVAGGSNENTPQRRYSLQVHWKQKKDKDKNSEEKVSVPIYISLLLISGYILSGAVLFTLWEEDWDYLIGSYFCFITLTTIGFGDYVPGTSMDSWGSQEKLVICCMYLLLGLALIACCFDLMQEEARNKCRTIGIKLGLIQK